MLAQSAQGFFNRFAPVQCFRAARDKSSAERFSRDLWRRMADMGFVGAAIPDDQGGAGIGYVGAGLIAQQAARTMAASPFISNTIAADILGRHGDQAARLPNLATGASIIALAVDEQRRHDPDRINTRAVVSKSGILLNGDKRMVIDAVAADQFVVTAKTDDNRLMLLLIDAKARGVKVESLDLLDCRDAADVRFHDVEAPADAVIASGHEAAHVLDRGLDLGRALIAAELLGLAEEAFDRTIAYLKEREQFGVKIGSFQALQHRAARMLIGLEIARSVVIKALRALDEGAADATLLASLAKGSVTRTARHILDEAVQLHGGIAVTDECDIGLFLKRGRVSGDLLGDDSFQKERLARLQWRI